MQFLKQRITMRSWSFTESVRRLGNKKVECFANWPWAKGKAPMCAVTSAIRLNRKTRYAPVSRACVASTGALGAFLLNLGNPSKP
jgi:hypothetical protein